MSDRLILCYMKLFHPTFFPFLNFSLFGFTFFFPLSPLCLSLSSLSFFTYNFYLLPFPSLVSALILCPLVFSNLVSFPHFLFLRHLVHTRFLSSLTSSLLALHSLYFSSFSTCLCVFMETERVTIPLMFPP